MLPSASNETAELAQCFIRSSQYWQQRYGQALWHLERAIVGSRLESISGQHALEFSTAEPLITLSAVRHLVQWAPASNLVRGDSTLVCDPSRLALEDESMDLVVIHHMLEILPYPHYMLSEAARVTTDSGRLVIVGWHPFGLATLQRWNSRRSKRYPYGQEWRSVSRLKDWLAFVDFEIERVDYCGFCLSSRGTRWESFWRRINAPLGRSYIIVAKRRKLNIVPIKPRFAQRVMFSPSKVGLSAFRDRPTRSNASSSSQSQSLL